MSNEISVAYNILIKRKRDETKITENIYFSHFQPLNISAFVCMVHCISIKKTSYINH